MSKELIEELRVNADAHPLDVRLSVMTEAADALESQAREIERYAEVVAVESCLRVKAEQELAALKAQPSGVVVDSEGLAWDALKAATDIFDRRAAPHAWMSEAWAAGSKVITDHRHRLNQPASGGDERAAWTAGKPTSPGAYWIRGNGLEADALVQVKREEGELWCNLHMCNSEADFDTGYTIEQLSSDFEWLGPLQARAALAQSEQKLDTKGSRKALGAMNAKLRAKVGRLERELAALTCRPDHREQVRQMVPEGWRIRECEDVDADMKGLIISSPIVDGERSSNSVWPTDADPAHRLLYEILTAAPAPSKQGGV